MTISVAVADDQALVRVGFCGIVAATPGLAVVGEAANGAEAVAVARSAGPDILLMDVRMPVLNGIDRDQADHFRRRGPPVSVSSSSTTFDLDEYVFGALRAGRQRVSYSKTPLPEDLSPPSGSWRRVRRCSRRVSPAPDQRVRAHASAWRAGSRRGRAARLWRWRYAGGRRSGGGWSPAPAPR